MVAISNEDSDSDSIEDEDSNGFTFDFPNLTTELVTGFREFLAGTNPASLDRASAYLIAADFLDAPDWMDALFTYVLANVRPHKTAKLDAYIRLLDRDVGLFPLGRKYPPMCTLVAANEAVRALQHKNILHKLCLRVLGGPLRVTRIPGVDDAVCVETNTTKLTVGACPGAVITLAFWTVRLVTSKKHGTVTLVSCEHSSKRGMWSLNLDIPFRYLSVNLPGTRFVIQYRKIWWVFDIHSPVPVFKSNPVTSRQTQVCLMTDKYAAQYIRSRRSVAIIDVNTGDEIVIATLRSQHTRLVHYTWTTLGCVVVSCHYKNLHWLHNHRLKHFVEVRVFLFATGVIKSHQMDVPTFREFKLTVNQEDQVVMSVEEARWAEGATTSTKVQSRYKIDIPTCSTTQLA